MFDTPESRWRALQTRNTLAASAFLYGVTTTRIYCRPTCPSRLARRANVVFFDSATDAECAGFRACKRCKPSHSDFELTKMQHAEAVRKACELMDAAGGRLSLADLADSVSLSPRYFHGIFKRIMGVTPNVYATGLRKEKGSRTLLGNQKPRMRGEVMSFILPRSEDGRPMSSENGSPLTEIPLDQTTPGSQDLGQSVLEVGCCADIDQWVLGKAFLTEMNVFDDLPVTLGWYEGMLSVLKYSEVHDTGTMVDQGVAIPSATQLPDAMDEGNFLLCGDLPSACSWAWAESTNMS